MIWGEYKSEFQIDGLMVIRIENTDLNDWQSLIDFLRSTEATLDYSIEGKTADLPSSVAEVVLDMESSGLLNIGLDGVAVHCHFLASDEIQLDLDPGQIDNENKARIVFRLMSTVGRTLKKTVLLAPKNNEEDVSFRYEPGKGIEHLALN